MKANLRFKYLQSTKKEPATQKAKGVWKLVQDTKHFRAFTRPGQVFLGINSTDELNGIAAYPFVNEDGVFCRPCPKTPRHGFVDSVRVSGWDETLALYERVLDVDPEAEIILMPFIECTHSSVFIPESGVLEIGVGHDGATSGREVVRLTLAPQKIEDAFRSTCGIASDSHAYLELLHSGKTTYIVQARSGPPLAGGATEYIPKAMRITQVLEPSDDLLAHEALCIALAGAEGVVFWSAGAGMSSHPAIHCYLNSIPFLTRANQPKVGDWIEPAVEDTESMFSLMEFHRGLRLSESSTESGGIKSDVAQSLSLAIAILHNYVSLKNTPHGARLLGYSVGWIFRAAAMACLGESRHYRGPASSSKSGALGTTNRTLVYEKAGSMANEELCTKLATFSKKFLASTWSGSYGGPKWFAALVQAVKLWNYVSVGRYKEAATEANILLNMAHNGGWLFNKFCSQDTMTRIAQAPAESLVSSAIQLYNLCTNELEVAPIKPRTYRASAKWSSKVTHKSLSGFRLKLHGVMTMQLDKNILPVLRDTFEHI